MWGKKSLLSFSYPRFFLSYHKKRNFFIFSFENERKAGSVNCHPALDIRRK
jgi:hypothetical protein